MRPKANCSRCAGVGLGVLLILMSVLVPQKVSADGVTHVVRSGDTLASIAQTYGTTVSAIVNANGLGSPDLIWVGQKLVIPIQGSGTGSGNTSASAKIHTVKLGDTLATIAGAYGVSASALASANGITNPDLLWVGQKLVIPSGSVPSSPPRAPTPTPAPAPASVPAPASTTTYTVKPGDTLGLIAARYGTTAAAIARANGLTSPDLIKAGMKLIIPRGSAPAPSYSGQASRFVASISKQHCWLYQGNKVIGSWKCSTGRRGWPTRQGTYRIQSKLPKAYGSTWNIWMPYWLGIYWAGSSENGIHGMPWNARTGKQTWPGLVGTRITYGCIMLNNAAAKMLYDMAYIGMPVIIQP